jgi:hypothetical protein
MPADQAYSGPVRAAQGENDSQSVVVTEVVVSASEAVAPDQANSEHPDNHGQCVRAVAGSEDTGGTQDNHGGAVSEAARVTCWETDEGVDEGSAETPETAQHGNSANAHAKNEAPKGGSGASGGGNGNKPPKPEKPPKSK